MHSRAVHAALRHIIYMLCGVCLVCAATACEDDDPDFDTGVGAQLVALTDTVRMDTVLAGVESSTFRFKFRNPGGKAVRVVSASLRSGGTSGVLVNIDGQALGSAGLATPIDVEKGDSIFCFAKICAMATHSDVPVQTLDELTLTLEGGATCAVVIEAWAQDVLEKRACTVTADERWDAAVPYLIYDSLVVAPSARLTLAAGTRLYFHHGTGLRVWGELHAEGEDAHAVTLRGDRTDNLLPSLPYDRLDGQWEGVTLMPSSRASLRHTDIHGGARGVEIGAEAECVLNCSDIHNVSGDALCVKDGTVRATNTRFSNAGGAVVNVQGGSVEMWHCTLAQFYPWKAEHGVALSLSAGKQDETATPLHKARFYNCIITGGETDQIEVSRPEDGQTDFDMLFDHSLVNIRLTAADSADVGAQFVSCVNEYEIARDEERQSSASADRDKKSTWGVGGFRLIDHDNYVYDFHLDSLSHARGIAAALEPDFALPTDKDGVERPVTGADAGCYQYVKKDDENAETDGLQNEN